MSIQNCSYICYTTSVIIINLLSIRNIECVVSYSTQSYERFAYNYYMWAAKLARSKVLVIV